MKISELNSLLSLARATTSSTGAFKSVKAALTQSELWVSGQHIKITLLKAKFMEFFAQCGFDIDVFNDGARRRFVMVPELVKEKNGKFDLVFKLESVTS